MPPRRPRTTERLLLAVLGLMAACRAAGATVAEYDMDALRPAASGTPRELFLELYLNGQPTHALYSFHQLGQRLCIGRDDLLGLGVSGPVLAPIPAVPGTPYVCLDQVPALQYRYDAQKQSVDLILGDGIRTPNAIGSARTTPAPQRSGTGLLLNYDAYAQADPDHAAGASLGLWSEQRLFSRYGILDNTGIDTISRARRDYMRLDTAWHYDFPDRLTTLQAGDAISSSLSWSRPVRLGGLQLRSNFNLRPDLVTFPVPQISGSAAVPSAVDLYVNNVRQISTEVPSGPFVINSVPGVNGAGMATVVVRDALGRAVSTSLPVYIDSRMLATGLQSYAVEGGALRFNYGSRSFDYNHPAFSGVYRYGLSDYLTSESHGEASDGLFNSGTGALVRLGEAGVVNGAVAGSSSAAGSGVQLGLGYQLNLPRFSLTTQSTRAYHGYRDLASIGSSPPPRALDQASVSMPLGRAQTFGLSYIHINDALVGASSIGTLNYTLQLPHNLSLIATAYQDFDRQASRGAWLGLSFYIGHQTSGFATAGTSNGQSNFSALANHNADYDGGWEWAAQATRSGASDTGLARAGYLGRYGEILAGAAHSSSQDLVSLEANGGVVWMDRAVELSRRIGDSFALVSTDGVAGVPVLHENRLLGVTDSTGHLLVPDLNSYQSNHLAIDSLALPADVRVPLDRIDAVPPGEAGVLARFPVEHYVAATLILHDAAGRELPPGTVLTAGTGASTVVGYDGLAFVDNLQPHNRLQASGPGLNCTVSFDYHPSGNRGELPTLGPLTCRASGESAP